jgi:hypothetical protein
MVVTPLGGDVDVIERNAVIAQNTLGYFWRRSDSTAVLRDMTQDCVILGNGFAKVGWMYSDNTMDRTPDEMVAEMTDLVAAAQEVAAESGMPMDEAMLSEIVESVTLTQHIVDVDEPFVEYVSPYDILVPFNARRMNSARWVAQRLRLSIEDLKSNEMFDKQARDDLKADTGYADPTTMLRFEETEQELPAVFKNATVFEFYDMKNRTLCVFQLDADRPLYEGPIPYEHRYPPFVHMRNFNDGGNSFWSFGDLENVAGLQLMINEIMVAELSDLKRVGNKYFINKKVLTPELAKALQDNKPDQVIPVDLPANISMQEVLQPVQRLSTPADNYIMEDKLQGYMRNIIGITDFQAGQIASSSRVPATAAAAVEGASTTRAMDKMSNVEKAAREIGTRLLALCQQFLDTEKAIRIAGPNAPEWLRVSQTDIEGEFSIETEGGSTQAINPATRARQGVEIMQNVVPMLAQLGFDPSNAMRTALTYMGLNPDHLLVTPPPPEPAPAAPMAPESMGMPPEMAGMAPGMPAPMAPTGGMDEAMMMQQLMDMGGAPIPAATEGGIAL